MGRPRRYLASGAYYHVTGVGNRGAFVFLEDDDRRVFLHLLRRVARRYAWRVHASCLLGTHYHLILETPEPNLSEGMRDLNGGYARGFNQRWGLCHHVFGRRYYAKLIETEEHYVNALEYVLQNPVKAGLARLAHDWPWTEVPAA
ncbi:MAG: transposase, partial [Actinobacteria bacterium]